MAGFFMKCNTGLKWVKWFYRTNLAHWSAAISLSFENFAASAGLLELLK